MDRLVWVASVVKDKRRRPFGPPLRNPNLKRRAILKNGEYNILPPRFKGRWCRYLHDIFTGLVDAEWKWTLQVLGIGFAGGWLIFSLIWWLIAFTHKDLHEDHLPAKQAETGWTPCVLNIHDFSSCFLYSLETQHTTGYGLRAITEECPEAIFILCCQCIIGMIIDGFTVGVVVAKMMRPRLANFTIQFSRNAVVALRNGELCMMFRAGDLRKAPLVGASIRAILIHNKKTKEGEILKYFETDLDVEVDSSGTDLFLIWPITIVHKINEDSPFFEMSAADMLRCQFEIILLLEGTVESTGQGTNAQTSYLSNEILWGRVFETMVAFNDDLQCYEANYANFDKTVPMRMPMCSAAEMKGSGCSGSEKDEEDKEDDIKVIRDEKTKPSQDIEDKESLELPFSPKRKKSEPKSVSEISSQSVTEKSPRRPSHLEIPPKYTSPAITSEISRQSRSHRSSILGGYYSPIRHTIELDGSIRRHRVQRPFLSRYEDSQHSHSPYENVSRGETGSETPPFPVDWV